MGILSILLWTPAAGVLLLALTSGQNVRLIRYIANLFTTIAFLLVCWLLSIYNTHDAGLQFNEYYPLNPKLGSAYALGVDGLSMPMLVLATLL
ncbi:MAG: NADH-quinone oxidoreductase subunit M, partial [Methylobacter sp.]